MAYTLFFLVAILPRLTDNFYSKHEEPMFCLGLRQACQSKNYMQRQVFFREKSCAFVAWCLCSIHIYSKMNQVTDDIFFAMTYSS